MIFIRFLAVLPLWALYGVSNFLYFMVWHVFKYRKKVTFTNLRNSFPEKTENEIKAIAKAYYCNLADVFVEGVKGLTITKKELNKRISVKNMEILNAYYEKGQPVIFLTTHHCNWEWMLLAGFKTAYPIDGIYKPLHNKKFDDLMLKIRSRFGGNPISMRGVMREIVKRRGQVRALGIVADQIPGRDDKKIWFKFLNQDTAFYHGTEKIVHFTDYPVFFIGMKRMKRGRYEITVKELATPPYDKASHDVMEKYVIEAERQIREAPADWLWSHRRWKYKKPDQSTIE